MLDSIILSKFFDIIQKACLPGIWSKGVALSRADIIITDSEEDEEITFRIGGHNHPVSHKVSLWPIDEDWYCDCEDRNSVCLHTAAAIITLKNKKLLSSVSTSLPKNLSSQLSYQFFRHQNQLHFERWIIHSDQREEILPDSLVSWMSGIRSGRISSNPLIATQSDYAADQILTSKKRGELDRSTLFHLLKVLANCFNISLDKKPITISLQPARFHAVLKTEKNGYRLQQLRDPAITEVFQQQGLVLCKNILKTIEAPAFTIFEKDILSGDGKYFPSEKITYLLTDILPALQKKISVDILVPSLPTLERPAPKIVLHLERIETELLSITPSLSYGENDRKQNSQIIFVPDPVAETMLQRRLQSELQLSLGQVTKLRGDAAVDFLLRSKNWETTGNGVAEFSLHDSLCPHILANEKYFSLTFQSASNQGKANPKTVLQAWRENKNYIPLLEGGWAPLPKDWLERYGDRISTLFAAQESSGTLPSYLLPEMVDLCEELGDPYPNSLKEFKNSLFNIEKMYEVSPPSDLTIKLRYYQQEGVNWLSFLRNAKMGALLADDMGLGKTLQALCVIQGRTLIVAPTSVLHSWASQIQQFRPALSVSTYHGGGRQLDKTSEVTLTSYALLRIDKALLVQEQWDSVVLDEAHMIKNPKSQVARAAHLLKANFRLALSGTPVENYLSDLWSQFQFLNPGLLGSLEAFNEQFSQPISQGDQEAAKRLKKKITPFILRRLKKEVAKELPPRTETVLYCKLSHQEREVYNSILAATRTEVIEKLEKNNGIFAALELLLRLRQACCHSSLVPGQTAAHSSKIDLLLETLELSIASNHRALIFSQWTSYLDLIEPALVAKNISFSRLDGTTRNREEVVQEFQNHSTPSVMLISLKAGGLGITLTAADHIFLMDPWWNPSVEEQAADRAHRIGQINPVLIHRIVAEDTIEERILELQKAKVQMATALLGESSASMSITQNDLLTLLKESFKTAP